MMNSFGSDAGCGILDTGYWILDAGYWILDRGSTPSQIGLII
jgi:hypothetical protein